MALSENRLHLQWYFSWGKPGAFHIFSPSNWEIPHGFPDRLVFVSQALPVESCVIPWEYAWPIVAGLARMPFFFLREPPETHLLINQPNCLSFPKYTSLMMVYSTFFMAELLMNMANKLIVNHHFPHWSSHKWGIYMDIPHLHIQIVGVKVGNGKPRVNRLASCHWSWHSVWVVHKKVLTERKFCTRSSG